MVWCLFVLLYFACSLPGSMHTCMSYSSTWRPVQCMFKKPDQADHVWLPVICCATPRKNTLRASQSLQPENSTSRAPQLLVYHTPSHVCYVVPRSSTDDIVKLITHCGTHEMLSWLRGRRCLPHICPPHWIDKDAGRHLCNWCATHRQYRRPGGSPEEIFICFTLPAL